MTKQYEQNKLLNNMTDILVWGHGGDGDKRAEFIKGEMADISRIMNELAKEEASKIVLEVFIQGEVKWKTLHNEKEFFEFVTELDKQDIGWSYRAPQC